MKASIVTLVLALILSGGVAYEVASRHVQPQAAPKEGSITGPISPYNYECVGSLCGFRTVAPVKTATTTACALQSPAATSTLGSYGVRIDSASSTATTWFGGTGTTQYATSTILGGVTTVAGGAQAFIQGSTSPAAGSNTVLGPNTWVIIKNNGGISAGDSAGTGFVPTGTCYASFSAPQF